MIRIYRTLMKLGALGALVLLSACGEGEHGRYTGYMEAEFVYVAPPEAGWLVAAPVREGDEVAAGAVLFELDKTRQEALVASAEGKANEARAQAADLETGARKEEIDALEAQLSEAKSKLNLAKAERDRWLPLVATDNATKAKGDQVVADYEAAIARVKAAEEEIAVAKLGGRDARRAAAYAAEAAAEGSLAEAEYRLDQRTVTAQVSGRIEEVFHRKGEYVNAGAPVLALLPDQGAMKARFFVPQAELDKFSVGGTVLLHADGLDNPVEADITHIAKEAEFTPPVIYSAKSRDTLVFLIEAKPAEETSLRPGLPVEVSLP